MRNNRYTQAIDDIKAPETSVAKMLETVRNYEAAEDHTVRTDRRPSKRAANRRIVRIAVAAVLAIAVALGAGFAPRLFGGKAGNAFMVTVYAAELTKDSPVCIGTDGARMNIVGKEAGGTEYYIELPVAVSSEHAVSVTWSIDKDAICLICPKDSDPVTAGNKAGEGFDSLFDKYYAEQAEKAGSGAAISSLLSRKYSSVTVDAAKQSDVLAMAVAGTSSMDSSEFYVREDKENPSADGGSLLAKRAELLNGLLGRTIHCTVTFDDGSQQQTDIQLSFAVMKASEAAPDAFARLSAEERAMKDYTGLFVVYSIVK